MAKLLEFLDRHTARNLFRSSHLKGQYSHVALLGSGMFILYKIALSLKYVQVKTGNMWESIT